MEREQVINGLSSSQGRKDEGPNIALAIQLAKHEDEQGVEHLIQIVTTEKASLKHDAIKVLYETGARNPQLLSKHLKSFLEMLDSKNNRLQWGAMTAIQTITEIVPKQVYENLVQIIHAGDKGSVISRDQMMRILYKLSTHQPYQKDALSLLFEQLRKCPTNQLPMYAEELSNVLPSAYRNEMVSILRIRISELEKASKIKRLEKVIRSMTAT